MLNTNFTSWPSFSEEEANAVDLKNYKSI